MLPRHMHKRKRFPKWAINSLWLIGLVVALPHCGKLAQQNQVRQERTAFDNINYLRKKNGRTPLVWDDRVYRLAKARVTDMIQHNYYDHTNPKTGDCPDTMKTTYGLQPSEFVAENLNGYPPGQAQMMVSPIQSVESWMHSRGHRYNLMFAQHTAGAVACEFSKCVFLGYNQERFGQGCHTAQEGMNHWKTTPVKPDEVQPSI